MLTVGPHPTLEKNVLAETRTFSATEFVRQTHPYCSAEKRELRKVRTCTQPHEFEFNDIRQWRSVEPTH